MRNSLRKHCRCHGLSGSCSLQTCWKSLNAFPEIASDIRKMYDRSKRITLDNNGNVVENVKHDTLIYLSQSQNYCHSNRKTGWKGTLGRECSRNRTEGVSNSIKKSCKNLCRSCGLKVRKRIEVVTTRCNCKFHWCCEVTCQMCSEKVVKFYCISKH